MTAINDDVTTASGFFKDVFGEERRAVPDGVRLIKYFPLPEDRKTGEKVSEPVWLTSEAGFTHEPANNSYALYEPVAAESKELTLQGSVLVLRSQVASQAFSRAVKRGQQAFGSFYRGLIKRMRADHLCRLETVYMHGGRSLATIDSVSGSGTTRQWTITLASWAPRIWTGSKNRPIDAYLVSGPTQRNTLADIVVTSVDFTKTAPKINVSGNATDLGNVVAGDELFFKGAYGNDPTGVIGAVSNTGSYLGIDGSSYDLWTGNTILTTGTLSWSKIQDGIEDAAGRGLDGDIVLFVSFPGWSDINSDISALRTIDAGYKTSSVDFGTQAITFYSHTGQVKVIPSGFCKGGEAFAFPENDVESVGSTEQTFENVGTGMGQYFEAVPGKHAVELQSMSDIAPKVNGPAKGFLISGIVNS